MDIKIRKIAAVAFCLILLSSQRVWGADINITYNAPESGKMGDTVKVEVDVSGSKSITTLGLRLSYDSSKLEYKNESWSESVESANAMTLVSDVESDGGKALNISMISDKGWQGNGNMVTLEFTAKEDYGTMPVELELRDITDKDMQDISSSTDVSSKTDDESKIQENNDDEDSSEREESPGGNGNTGNGEENGGGISSSGNSGSENQQAAPKTYQTGIEVMDAKVLSAGGLFLAVSILCILLKRRLSR